MKINLCALIAYLNLIMTMVIKSNEVEDIYRQNLNAGSEQNKGLSDESKKFVNNLKSKIDEIKNKINKELDQFYNDFLKEINNKNDIVDISEEMNKIKNNYPPKNKEELNKLIDSLVKLYNNKKNNNQEDKSTIKKNLNDYESLYQEKLDFLDNFISQLSNLEIEKYEWSTITYGKGFFYKLEEGNTKATKISGGGDISVCRGMKPLQQGHIYKLEYSIDYCNDGDIDVGFGDNTAGRNCWLRGYKAYSITSDGIFLNSVRMKNTTSKIVKENKKIIFIIDLKNNTSEILIDGQKACDFNIPSDLVYYPMISIRQLNNSVKINLTKIK